MSTLSQTTPLPTTTTTTTLPAGLPSALTPTMPSETSSLLGTTLPATLEPVPAAQITLPTTSAPDALPKTGRSMSAVERWVIVIALAVAVVMAGIILSLSSKK